MQARAIERIGRIIAIPELWTRLALAIIAVIAITVSLATAPGSVGLLGAGLAIVMIAIAAVDWRRFVIPDWLNAVGLGLALVHAALQEPDAMPSAVATATLRGAALALIFLALRNGYALIRGRQGLGLGDVKLAAVAGAWLDWLVIPIAIELAAFAALTIYLFRHLAFGGSISATNRLPFGAFFAPAIWVSWVLEMKLFVPF